MALTKTIVVMGVTVQDAYIKVANVTTAKNDDDTVEAAASVAIFGSQAVAESADGVAFTGCLVAFPYNLAGANPLQQAYDYLKANTYVGATDVLEAGQTA